MRYVILGTAGHIDHGKSTLVKALTGIDPDRLKEEKERGITIDLGFADLEFDDGLRIGIVDVPGHEKLVKNMLAGAGGIDIVMLVISADEGVMPQTREHLNICSLLHIKKGFVALTKCDLVEPEWLELVKDEIRGFVKGTFLESSAIIPVSAKTGINLDILKNTIRIEAFEVKPKPSEGLFRMPIDRVFTLKGFGTIVTGTAVTGAIKLDETIEILPRNITCKVRGLHSHGHAIEKAYAGQRVAVNLQGIEKEDLQRGDTIVTVGRFAVTDAIDVKLELLPNAPKMKSRDRVHFYAGTSETIARAVLYDTDELLPGGQCFCQMRLDDPIVAQAGDRFIVRRFSPVETIGGGVVLDPTPQKRKKKDGIEDLPVLDSGSLMDRIEAKVKKAGVRGMTSHMIEGWIFALLSEFKEALKTLKNKGLIIQFDDIFVHHSAFEALGEAVKKMVSDFHRNYPLKEGLPKEEVRTSMKIDQKLFVSLIARIEDIAVDKEILRMKSFKVAMTDEDKKKILAVLDSAGLQPPARSELAVSLNMDEKKIADILKHMQKEGTIARINDTYYLSAGHYAKLIEMLRGFFDTKTEMTVAEFRDVIGTSRKYAVPYLEHLDSSGITMRVGDVRKFLGKK